MLDLLKQDHDFGFKKTFPIVWSLNFISQQSSSESLAMEIKVPQNILNCEMQKFWMPGHPGN